jgi:hypothetical protein
MGETKEALNISLNLSANSDDEGAIESLSTANKASTGGARGDQFLY